MRVNWDGLGMGVSIACAIHCALLPLVLTSLPLLGLHFFAHPAFEYGMIGLAFVIGILALRHGLRHHHHSYLPIIVFSIGFSFLLLKEIFSSIEFILLVPAVFFILLAHGINLKLCKKKEHHHIGNPHTTDSLMHTHQSVGT